MKVKYIRGVNGLSKSNIMFPKSWPMRGGKWPKDHPCSANHSPMIFGSVKETTPTDNLGIFRELGYADASCFPEGDGICFSVDESKPDAKVIADIRYAFSWDVASGSNDQALRPRI